jgi:hypothetical protein
VEALRPLPRRGILVRALPLHEILNAVRGGARCPSRRSSAMRPARDGMDSGWMCDREGSEAVGEAPSSRAGDCEEGVAAVP